MSDRPVQGEPPAPTPEEVRQPFHDLYLLSLPDDLLLEIVGARLVDNMPDMAGVAGDMASAPVERVYKLHAVASALTRKPELAEQADDRSSLATAMMTGTDDRPTMEQGLATFASRRQQEAEQSGAGRLTPALWREFLGLLKLADDDEPGPQQARPRLVDKPGCNDGETVDTADGEAAVIISRFWTTYDLDAMAHFIEPRYWKECGAPFWSDVRLVDKRPAPTSNPGDYDATYDETVNLPLTTTIRVRLDVKYRVHDRLIRLDYDLSPVDPYDQVTLDSGFLAVTTVTYGDHGEPTLVECAKAIRFTDPLLNRLPDLACDGGWVYMMINMALNGTGVTETLRPSSSVQLAPPGFGPIVATIDAEIDDWIKQARDSLTKHGVSAKNVTHRVLAPQHDPRWINDFVGMTHGAIAMTGATLGAWRRILRQLGSLGGGH
jgi:hypothetical protein